MDGTWFNSIRRVAVLAGGESAEREISLRSGAQATDALLAAGFSARIVDALESPLESVNWSAFDLAFIALHGGAGEDGRIQTALDELDVPYTGSGPEASRLAIDKGAAKREFLRCSLRTPPFTLADAGPAVDVAQLGYPLIVKPNKEGSSVGLGLANNSHELAKCIARARDFDHEVLLEKFIAGREFTIALLGRRALPIVEIFHPQTKLFSFDAKYKDRSTEFRVDAELSAEVAAELTAAAIAAARALATDGLVRVDVILDTANQPWILEVNTIPGLTSHSLAPLAARATGIDMPALVHWMVMDAVCRGVAKRNRRPARERFAGVGH